MFSSIDEAWDNNPVREITNKLTNGSFNKDHQSNHTNIYKFKKDPPNSDSGINLLSEDMSIGQDFTTNFSSCSPLGKSLETGFSNSTTKVKNRPKQKSINSNISSVEFSEFETTANMSTTEPVHPVGTECSFSIRHLNKCNKCFTQLNKLINKKVKGKINDIFLDINLNQIKLGQLNQQSPPPQLQLAPQTGLSDSWKETLIIIVGAVIALFIIFLITKSFNSGKN